MSRARLWRREPTSEVCPGDFIPRVPAPRQPGQQRRDRGASHHGELAAQRPRAPDLGLGQEASALGTHLGRAARAGGGEGGHVVISGFLLLSFARGRGRGSERPRKTFFKVRSASRNFSWPGSDGCQLSEAREWGDVCAGSRRWERGRFPPAGKMGQSLVPLGSHWPGRGSPARWRGSRPAAPLGPRAPLPPAGTGAGRSLSRSARPPASARWEGRRGPHQGRRGPQVGRAPGGGQAPESESARVQLRAPRAWAGRAAAGGSLLSKGAINTPTPTPPHPTLPRCEVAGPFRVSGERLAREEVEFFVPFPLALGEYLEVAGFFSNLGLFLLRPKSPSPRPPPP